VPSINTYSQEYIDHCRSRVHQQLATYRGLVNAAKADGGAAHSGLDTAIAEFDATFFNNMVLVLDDLFVHRSRTKEKKDGNPLNEVRVLCNSLLLNDGALVADTSITLNPAKTVLGHAVGDRVVLSAADFARLSEAYFSEIEDKYL